MSEVELVKQLRQMHEYSALPSYNTAANAIEALLKRSEAAEAQVAALRENLKGQTNYSIDLQRIIEALCERRPLEEPKTTARFHYDMARNALEASR